MSFISIYKGYSVHSIQTHATRDLMWAARRPGQKEDTPFDLAATSFDEIRCEIDAAVRIENALEEYLATGDDPKTE